MLSTLKSSLTVSLISLTLVLSLTEVSQAHRHHSYSHDPWVMTANPRWMTSLKGDVLLSELSIPGTHDSMALHGGPAVTAIAAGATAGTVIAGMTTGPFAGIVAPAAAIVGAVAGPFISVDVVRTQRMTLSNQLESGIRALDIRCRQVGDGFAIHHGQVYQHANFDDVLKAVVKFLRANPGETVVMRVKEEFTGSKTFAETFRLKYWENKDYKEFMWQGKSENPTLREMRRKIVILQDFDRKNHAFGIPYPSSFSIQDTYTLTTNWELYDKWLKVKAHLEAANKDVDKLPNRNTKYVNYLSASGGVFPYFVASGHSNPATGAPRLATGRTTPAFRNSWPNFPRLNCAGRLCTISFEGTNTLTYGALGTYYKNRVGIIMADFPGGGLINRTIALNNRFKE